MDNQLDIDTKYLPDNVENAIPCSFPPLNDVTPLSLKPKPSLNVTRMMTKTSHGQENKWLMIMEFW